MESLWKKTEEYLLENEKELDKEIQTDVCIIGGGITGITTAYYLSKEGKKVTILERENLADKATGNTTAKITSQHGLFYDYLLNDYGKDFAKKYYLANEEAIKNIEKIIKEENIECDFSKQSAYVFTQDAKNIDKIKTEVNTVKSIGGEAEFVERIEPKLENVHGAVKFPNQAEFNPRKYLKGIVNAIIKNGGEIYQNSRAYSIKKNDEEYIVYTDEGSVRAKYIVLATQYPIINVPGFYFIKMYQETSYAIAVETSEELFEGMYINNEEKVISLRTAIYEGKKVLVVAGMTHRVGAKINLDDAYNELESVAKKMYNDAKVICRWSTQDCITLDKIPYIGEFSKMMKNVYVRNRL